MSKQHEEVGPGLAPAIILGILTLILGMVLGVASLVSQPVIPVSKMPEPDMLEPGKVYYAKGSRLGRTAWEAKEEAWKAGTVSVLSLNEVELNQWSQRRFQVAGNGSAETVAGWTDKLKIETSGLNFRILEDQVQVSTELSLNGLFPGREFVYMVYGRFQPTPTGARFVPEHGTLGTAALGSVPGLKSLLFNVVANKFAEMEVGQWVSESLEGLDSAEIAGGQLVLRRRAES